MKPVICGKCESSGLQSKVYPSSSIDVTNVMYSPFYDEYGAYHVHDFNKRTTSFICSNGHRAQVKLAINCPTCGELTPEEIKYLD